MMHLYMIPSLLHLQMRYWKMYEEMKHSHLLMDFSRYHHIIIAPEDHHKTTFST
jgi:hypothetical protein